MSHSSSSLGPRGPWIKAKLEELVGDDRLDPSALKGNPEVVDGVLTFPVRETAPEAEAGYAKIYAKPTVEDPEVTGVYVKLPDGTVIQLEEAGEGGGAGDLSSPGPIGDVTPSTGAFTSLTVNANSVLASIDEDSFASDLATRVPTQQSVKAYVDAGLSGKANTAHTQAASTITDFDTEVSNNTDVAANTAARHTHANAAVLSATTASFTLADEAKLDGIETLADVTDATNVDAAGAVMNSDTSTTAMQFVIDEDSFVSDLATKVPTQQSVKTYVDAGLANKANSSHTHTASAITNFDTAVSSNSDVAANTASRHSHSNLTVLNATTASFTTSDETKLDGIEAGATVNSPDATLLARANHTGTQLASTISNFQTTVSANTDVAANTAARHTHSNSVVLDATTASFTIADETKLDGIASGATANSSDATLLARANHTGTQTASTISDFATAVTNHVDVAANTAARHTHSNSTVLNNTTASFTTADETKLDGIEALADVTDADNVASVINGATTKTTPVDADIFPLTDSAASGVIKKLSWQNVKATQKTYFDTIYATIAHTHAQSDVTNLTTDLAGKASTGAIGSSGLTMSTSTVLGRTTASTGAVEELSANQLSTFLDNATDPFVRTSAAGGGGGGTIDGSTGSIDNAIIRADGTGGTTLQSSALQIVDATTYSSQVQTQLKFDDGSSTNIHAVVTPKGSGAFILGPAPGASAGNNRGTHAVDLQMLTNLSTRIASGATSFCAGSYNTASGPGSIAMGPGANIASGSGAVAIGTDNTSSGTNAFAIGKNNTASGAWSVALGNNSSARTDGMLAFSVNQSWGVGTSQNIDWAGAQSSTNATPVHIRGSYDMTQRFTIPTDTLVVADIWIGAIEQGAADHAFFRRKVAIVNDNGTTALVGSVETIGTDQLSAGASSGSWSVAITADDTNDALQILVTGEAATNIRWVCRISGAEVKYS